MSSCNDVMIGIRTGGVFSGKADMEDLRARIKKVIRKTEHEYPFGMEEGSEEMHDVISHELEAGKGSYVVIAGVFNYFSFKSASEFAAALSEEFGVEVMLMHKYEVTDTVRVNIFLCGKPLFEINENPVRTVLRRVL